MWLHCVSVCYDPSVNGRFVTDGKALNSYSVSHLKAEWIVLNAILYFAASRANSVVTRSS